MNSEMRLQLSSSFNDRFVMSLKLLNMEHLMFQKLGMKQYSKAEIQYVSSLHS